MPEKAKEKAEKIKWVLKNYGRAKARAKNLKVAAKNMEYSLQAKTAVGGGRGNGRAPSEQEKYMDNQTEMLEEADCLAWNVEAIEEAVKNLPEKERQAIEGKYFEELSYKVIGRRMEPQMCKASVKNKRKDGVERLKGWGLVMIYKPLYNLLEEF